MRVLFGARPGQLGLGRVIVTLAGTEAAAAAGELLGDWGVDSVVVDVGSEDSFVDIDELVAGVDAAGADAVINFAPGAATPVALAALHDVPILSTTRFDSRHLRAIAEAVDTGSEIHRCLLEVHVGSMRRLCPRGIELQASSPLRPLLDGVPARGELAESRFLHVDAEQPASGQLSVDTAQGGTARAGTVEVRDIPGTSLVVASRAQQVDHVIVGVHDRPLRELVLGTNAGRTARSARRGAANRQPADE